MSWKVPKLVPRSGPVILLILTAGAVAGFAGVGHLVTRYNLNQQALGRKLYEQGMKAISAEKYDDAIEDFRAALVSDPSNSRYQLSLARALRDSNDPRRLDEAESYLLALWQRTPQDAAVNLALARVAAHRGSIEDAIRYYHNAMYGVWNSNPDENRNRTRIELIEYLLQRNARAEADSELIALAAALPRDAAAHLQAAQLFMLAQDYAGALGQFEEVLHLQPNDEKALAGAGEAAYLSRNYSLALHYLRNAVLLDHNDIKSRELLAAAELVQRSDPFHGFISDAERNRRISAAFSQAETRLTECARRTGTDLNAGETSSPSSLANLQSRWNSAKPDLAHLRSPGETDLPDAIMEVVFQIEQQTAATCGQPQGLDLALLLISEKREAAAQ